MRRTVLAAATAVLLAALTACGGDSGPQLSARSRDELVTRVDAVQASLGAYQPDTARAELSTLRAQVADLQQAHKISDEQASEILSAAAAVEADLSLAPTTTTTTTTTLPAPPDKPGKDKDNPGKDKGNKHADDVEDDD